MKEVNRITVSELKDMASMMYGDMVKAVVDLNKKIIVVDAELHADQESYLLQKGSVQQDLWGINLYPDEFGTAHFIEFDSMINIRPRQNNRSRDVEDASVRKQIIELISRIVVK